jgi:NADH:ubiquinone oxidoreductase subunit E
LPVLTIDGEVYGNLTKAQLPDVLAKYQGAPVTPAEVSA